MAALETYRAKSHAQALRVLTGTKLLRTVEKLSKSLQTNAMQCGRQARAGPVMPGFAEQRGEKSGVQIPISPPLYRCAKPLISLRNQGFRVFACSIYSDGMRRPSRSVTASFLGHLKRTGIRRSSGWLRRRSRALPSSRRGPGRPVPLRHRIPDRASRRRRAAR